MKKNKIYSLLGFLFTTGAICTYSLSAQVKAPITGTDTSKVVMEQAKVEEPYVNIPNTRSVTSISSVSGSTLAKTPVPNITNTLYGLLQGLTVRQGSGEPGYDGASLNIRGIGTYDNSSLVIYVDGFQTTSSYFQYLSPSEIESVTVLKDPASLATFGMKGANGVLWVVTKRGTVGKPRITASVVSGVQQAININKPYGAYDYARLYNEAISNDNYSLNGNQFVWTPKYSDDQLQAYKNGKGTNVDWYDQVLRKNGPYTDANLIFTGGDPTTKYNVVLDYMRQQGLYDVTTGDRTSNAQIQRFNLRTNLDFNFFKIFEAKVDLGGRIEDRRYPNFDGPSLWQNLSVYPSNIYPVRDSLTGMWSGTSIYPNNPVASLKALGWVSTHDRTLQANFNLKEKLDFITPGLYMNEAVSFNTWTRNSSSRTASYARYYEGTQTTTDKTTDLAANGSWPTDQYDWKQINFTAGYDRTFGLHSFSAAANYYLSDYTIDYGTNYSGQNFGNNIFYHFENVSGKFYYAYDSKYLLEGSFGLSGSDNFASGHRWGFYPAVAAGWVVSNESFLKDNKVISFLKVRASIGKTGYDQSNKGRYLYQQYFVGNGTFYTGSSLTGNGGIVMSYAANPDIFAEKSVKYNVGTDITLFNKLSVVADLFQDKRSGIVTQNNDLMAVYGGTLPYSNIGKVTNKGFEASADFTDKIGQVSYTIGGAAAYTRNIIDYQSETPTVNDFSKSTGRAIGTPIGLIATGFYDVTDFNADGTLKNGIPTPAFGAVQPGDIKYKDLDNNGVVNEYDVTKIGKPTFPSLTYSFHFRVGYKGFDLTALFQGVSGNSINLLSAAYYQTVAFVNNINVYPIANNAWAYYPSKGIDTRATATYPRLTTQSNNNNYRNSTFWMKKGDFLRLRNIEFGYNLPAGLLSKIYVKELRIYVNAVNPFTWSYLSSKYNIDPETTSGYAGLKSYNAGISLTF
ncbi:MAG: SusC/RagA family TonB-linked outer membrane protein [Bacteroidota bacterium]|nr:SusC/RagA family TonB-linked outer membrane protein [Bacteroidota bacterium]MDP4225506.1 SusC/RagA family TonB-linked outer membrane protein [Bacteroidota bacterium]MDP4273466.1 SusC/RagA family TonB-linked outer membrane protein [Bacteroidota bacterium]